MTYKMLYDILKKFAYIIHWQENVLKVIKFIDVIRFTINGFRLGR